MKTIFASAKQHKRLFLLTISTLCFCLVLPIGLTNCDSSNPGTGTGAGESEVTFRSEMSSSSVILAQADDKVGAETQAITGLQIQRVRILVKELKVKPSKDNSGASDKQIKLSPFVIDWRAGQILVFATAPLPVGEYDQAKFQFHRFTPPEVSQYQNDPVFRDFVTPDRVTVIIEGSLTDNGRSEAFVYRSDVTANLNLNFDNVITVSTSKITIALQFNPSVVFRRGSALLDPRDSRNRNDIDNLIRTAIRAFKK